MVKNTEKLRTIGSKTFISFPRQQIENVPAKIDTGADSTSVWASQIYEKKGELSFCLFDKQSPFYNGQVISTHDYELTSVKNSFGTEEMRYKTRLNIKVGGKVVRVRSTLSDRSTSTFPVLIGRGTLRGKFIVDVSKKPVVKKKSSEK